MTFFLSLFQHVLYYGLQYVQACFWTGLNDRRHEGRFTWGCSSSALMLDEEDAHHHEWRWDQPGGGGADKDCVRMVGRNRVEQRRYRCLY